MANKKKAETTRVKTWEENPVALEPICPRCGKDENILRYISSAGVARYWCISSECKSKSKSGRGRGFVIFRK